MAKSATILTLYYTTTNNKRCLQKIACTKLEQNITGDTPNIVHIALW